MGLVPIFIFCVRDHNPLSCPDIKNVSLGPVPDMNNGDWDKSQTSIMETGTSPRELFWVTGTGQREHLGLQIIISIYNYIVLAVKVTLLTSWI